VIKKIKKQAKFLEQSNIKFPTIFAENTQEVKGYKSSSGATNFNS
jgi:hypothetical protein